MDRNSKLVRHEIRIRVLDVLGVKDITPRLRRVTLGGPDLAGFSSPGYSDHVKLFFPEPGQAMVLPEPGPQGLQFPPGTARPPMRDYTPLNHDAERLTLDFDFVLHGDGPAASWAAQAAIGQKLVMAGPRGSLLVPLAFDWYLFAGDTTGLPAMARRLAELPAGVPAVAVVEIDDASEELPLPTAADLKLVWVHRNGVAAGGSELLVSAVAGLSFPEGDAYAFLAGESGASKALRAFLVEQRGFNPEWIKAAGYWLKGVADAHEPH